MVKRFKVRGFYISFNGYKYRSYRFRNLCSPFGVVDSRPILRLVRSSPSPYVSRSERSER